MTKNANLHKAKRDKVDEFYTLYEDVEKELQYYQDQFIDKVVYCNCDSKKSAIYQYFVNNYHTLKLKALVATHYSLDNPYKLEYNGEVESVTPLVGNGSFDSDESVELLSQCDVVVSNPPFSLYRQYLPLIMEYDKQFLVIGPLNIITYKQIFPYIKDEMVWCGVNQVKRFIKPDGSYKVFGNTYWFTNLKHSVVKDLTLTKTYDPVLYPRYDNYDAINVDKVKDIPIDYPGVIGVPITYLLKHNPQFEIVGTSDRGGDNVQAVEDIRLTENKMDSCIIGGEKVYKRLFIKQVTE